MSRMVDQVMGYEVTPIPAALRGLWGTRVDNRLCNGAFWLLALWTGVHAAFDASLGSALARAGCRPYASARWTDSCWSALVSLAALAYFGGVAAKYRLEPFNWESRFLHADVDPPADVSLGILLLCTFHVHAALYRPVRAKGGAPCPAARHLLLTLIYALTFATRKIEIAVLLPLFAGASRLSLAGARLLFCATEGATAARTAAFAASLVSWVAVHVVVAPLRLLLLPARRTWRDFGTAQAALFLLLVVWLVAELYESVLLKWFSHWLEHAEDDKYSMLSPSALDFALFDRRRDAAFYWKTLRSETKTRGDEMMARRKPNNRNVLFQTVKCMLALRRKRNAQQRQENEDWPSDTPSGNQDAGGAEEEKEERPASEEGKLVIELQQ